MPSEKGSVFFPFLGATMTASPVRLHGLLFLTLPSQESIVPPHLHTFFFAVTRRICVFDRASLEMSWDVTVAFTYPSYLKRLEIEGPTRTYLLSLRVKDLRAAILRLWLR